MNLDGCFGGVGCGGAILTATFCLPENSSSRERCVEELVEVVEKQRKRHQIDVVSGAKTKWSFDQLLDEMILAKNETYEIIAVPHFFLKDYIVSHPQSRIRSSLDYFDAQFFLEEVNPGFEQFAYQEIVRFFRSGFLSKSGTFAMVQAFHHWIFEKFQPAKHALVQNMVLAVMSAKHLRILDHPVACYCQLLDVNKASYLQKLEDRLFDSYDAQASKKIESRCASMRWRREGNRRKNG